MFTFLLGETTVQCPEGLFKCKNGKCISRHLQCNDVDDCGDESDEQKCGKCLSYVKSQSSSE